jgi:thioredoxin-like negative regulator of GroEL
MASEAFDLDTAARRAAAHQARTGAASSDRNADYCRRVAGVVDFWARWRGRMIASALQDPACRHAGKLKVVKVDVDVHPQLGVRLGAPSIALRDGRGVDRVLGAPAPRALEARLAPLVGSAGG